MNTGLLLEESVLGVPVSMVPPSSFASCFQGLPFAEVSRRIGHLEPVDHLLDLDGFGEVLVDGVVDEALLVPALSWRYLGVLGVALAVRPLSTPSTRVACSPG